MSGSSFKVNEDFWIGLSCFVFSVVLFISVNALPKDVALFPKFILIVIGLVGASIIIKVFVSPRESNQEKSDKIFTFDLLVMFIALIVTYFLLDKLGFYLTVMLFSFFTFVFMEKSYNKKSFMKGGILSVLLVFGVYFLFHVLMSLRTPEGILF
ncbi:tripartite tricarboxylate transporter TctB family protein [bacterium LRH843]|nr:tripartite tricarboxylate transporter TctB family protein [bacterium LRH843]